MEYSYATYADEIISKYNLKHKSGSEYGNKPCPNCGGTDRFWIAEYQGLLRHHCRKECNFSDRQKALQRDGVLPVEPEGERLKEQFSLETPYHVRKRINLLGDCAVCDGDTVVVKIVDIRTGELRGNQLIKPDGSKKFTPKLRKEGAGTYIGEPTDVVYVAEGWANAVIVHQATGKQSVFALDAGNIPKTVAILRELGHDVVVAADADEAGIKAAKASGAPWAAPINAGEDWWDVFNRDGKDGVKLGLEEIHWNNGKVLGDVIKWKRLSELADSAIKEREWTVNGWIPRGQVTLIYADGGVGKSQIILQLLTSVALGERWFGLQTAQGRALYLGAEDDYDELHRRFDNVIKAGFKSYNDFHDVIFTSLAGQDALLASYDPRSKRLNPSHVMEELEAAIVVHSPVLCVVDTLADVFPGDENDRALARQFISMLRKPAIERNCALVVLAHPSLSGISSGRGTSGSTGWNNSVRSRITMERDEQNPDRRILRLAKSNYSKIGTEISITWENGVFIHDPQSSGLDAQAANSKARRVFLSLLGNHNENGMNVNANGGSTHAPKVFADHPNSEGVTKKAFGTAMKSLLAEGVIKSEETKRGTRLVVIKR